MYGQRTPPEDPPCYIGNQATGWKPCRTDPLPENADALRVWLPIRHQWRMGFNGPVDIDHIAVESAMRREGVTGRECWAKVLRLNQYYMERVKNASE